MSLFYMFQGPLPNPSKFEGLFQSLNQQGYRFGLLDLFCQRVISNKLADSAITFMRSLPRKRYPYLFFHLVDLLTLGKKLQTARFPELDNKTFTEIAYIQLLNYLLEKDLPFRYGKAYLSQLLANVGNDAEEPLDQNLEILIEEYVSKTVRVNAPDFENNIQFLQENGLRRVAEGLLQIKAASELANNNIFGYFEVISKMDWIEKPLCAFSMLNSIVIKIYLEDWDLSFAPIFLRDNKDVARHKFLDLVVNLLNDLYFYLSTDSSEDEESALLERLRRLMLKKENYLFSKDLWPLILTHTIGFLERNTIKPTEDDIYELLDRLETTSRELTSLTGKILSERKKIERIQKPRNSKNVELLFKFESASESLSGLLLKALGNCH